ncbi:hypothetical protein J2752_002275 [Halarchaeum rubridurum]|uniref:Uncharacterized protein n=1 Tax=Halarchaeum rubridurum TaxID=489911 RepID=A0A830G1Z1_9EURY|nr:hypothetical protein [Halarchaeum rubridurum]MBP1955352.1 hypothetical protein [Halarchaeum rubridurum]GGM71709.1 hypothetical protein GCM10009017_22060 [Halarchaeum rubridurum]
MDRRTFLARGAGLAGLCGLAGCLGASADAAPVLVASSDVDFDDAGALVVEAVVSNVEPDPYAATVVFGPEIDGGTRERTADVTLDPNSTRVVRATYDDVRRADAPSVTPHVSLRDVRRVRGQ